MCKCKSRVLVSQTISLIIKSVDDKSELMKERIKLEKANKNGDMVPVTKESQQKRKNQNDTVGKKNKKKPETDDQAKNAREKDRKAKEKEDKRKKKEEEQRRKDFILEAKKAQAAERWSSTSLDTTNFTPEPLRRASNPTPAAHAPVQLTTPVEPMITAPHTTPLQTDPSLCQTPGSGTPPDEATPSSHTAKPPARRKALTPQSSLTSRRPTHTTPLQTDPSSCRTPGSGTPPDEATPSSHTAKPPARRKALAPQSSLTSRRPTDSRRGIHFQSPSLESSEEEISEESDEDGDNGDTREIADETGACRSCCKEQKVENEALRKRLQKLHRRLNIACKSSFQVH